MSRTHHHRMKRSRHERAIRLAEKSRRSRRRRASMRHAARYTAEGINMTECVYCGVPIDPDRSDLGYKSCVACGVDHPKRGHEFVLLLVPKQGFTVVQKDDREALRARRGSGR